MVARAGPLATRNCESRQIRKEATAAVDVCAGVGTVWVASIINKVAFYQALLSTCREGSLMYDQMHLILILSKGKNIINS